MTVTTRFAPSPTGWIHVGNLRTALMNYLIARQNGGTFILRLDDTDQERSKQEYIDGLKSDLDWLGIRYDRIEQQSKRMDRYAEAAERLKAAGRFYECFESPVELDLKRKKQLNMGKPPVYDRAALNLTEEQKAAYRAEGLLALQAGSGADRVEGRDHRRYLDRRRKRLGPGADQGGRAGAVYLRVVGG
jgi:glutamyl-tRNA synthetase